MKVLAVLPFVAAYQVLETSHHVELDADKSYDGMKQTLISISAMQQKGEIDEATINTVTSMLNKIQTDLKGALVADVTSTQSLLDSAESAVIACDTAKNNWNANGFATENTAVSTARSAHDTCRGEEQVECNNATNHCNTYTAQVCNFKKCDKPAASRFSTSDNDDVFAYMCCLKELFDAERASYYNNRWSCLAAVNIWNTKSAECDTKQTQAENRFCTRETNVENACYDYRTCRNREQAAYTITKGNVQTLEEIYRAQREALECLMCYGGKILANDTDLSKCETPPVCTSLTDCPTIIYDDLPSCIPCTEPDHDVPCTADFLSLAYNKYENTCTPPQQCQTCVQHNSKFAQTEATASCNAVAETNWEISKGMR